MQFVFIGNNIDYWILSQLTAGGMETGSDSILKNTHYAINKYMY